MDNAMDSETEAEAPVIYDAIVVGGGPSGSSAAMFLAKKGKKVLLLEKAKFPRDKTCGDAASGKSIGVIKELGLVEELTRRPHWKIRGLTMVSPEGKAASVPYPNAKGLDCAGYTIRRLDLDEVLFRAACEHENITVLEGFTVTEVTRDENGNVNGVKGTDSRNNSEKEFGARVVVGADGATSIMASSLKLPSIPKNHTAVAVRGYWYGVSNLSDNIELFFLDGVLPGYFWIFPMANGYANVGLGMVLADVQARKINPVELLHRTIKEHEHVKNRFAEAQQEGATMAWTITNGSFKRKNHGEGWVLLGDAASLVDPFSGEGVGNATASGKFAAEAIAKALDNDPSGAVLSEQALSEYGQMIEKHLRPELEMSYNILRASRNRFLLNMFLNKAATKPEMKQVLTDMLANENSKQLVKSPLFYLRLLLP